MKKYLKAIGCFAIFVLAVFSYFREQSYKLDSLQLLPMYSICCQPSWD